LNREEKGRKKKNNGKGDQRGAGKIPAATKNVKKGGQREKIHKQRR